MAGPTLGANTRHSDSMTAVGYDGVVLCIEGRSEMERIWRCERDVEPHSIFDLFNGPLRFSKLHLASDPYFSIQRSLDGPIAELLIHS
jgi:hypothetical protein